MNKLSLAAITLTMSHTLWADVVEVTSLSYKSHITLEKQKQSMENLSAVLLSIEGVKSRAFYYNEESNKWLDFIVWDTLENAHLGPEEAIKHPDASKAFSMMDNESVNLSYYKQMGGFVKTGNESN